MLDATHLLLSSIRRPHAQGTYELSMRLVDARTGRIVWEDLGDRRFTDVMLTVPPETNAQSVADKQVLKSESSSPVKSDPHGSSAATNNTSKPSNDSGRTRASSPPSSPPPVNYSQTLPGTYTHSDPNGTRTITLMPNGELLDTNYPGSHSWAWRGRFIFMYWVIPSGRGRLPYQYTYGATISEDGTSYMAAPNGTIIVKGEKE